MTTAIIISAILFVLGLVATVSATLFDWKDWVFITGVTTTIVFCIATITLILCNAGVIKHGPKEYPASEYTFKIKVVEFEEQRDTILVVIPKEKNE